jgi:hypothetical protein
VSLAAPVVRHSARWIRDHSHSDLAEVLRVSVRNTGVALVLGARNRRPVSGAKGYPAHLPKVAPLGWRSSSSPASTRGLKGPESVTRIQ